MAERLNNQGPRHLLQYVTGRQMGQGLGIGGYIAMLCLDSFRRFIDTYSTTPYSTNGVRPSPRHIVRTASAHTASGAMSISPGHESVPCAASTFLKNARSRNGS